jgi:hypothetical protein
LTGNVSGEEWWQTVATIFGGAAATVGGALIAAWLALKHYRAQREAEARDKILQETIAVIREARRMIGSIYGIDEPFEVRARPPDRQAARRLEEAVPRARQLLTDHATTHAHGLYRVDQSAWSVLMEAASLVAILVSLLPGVQSNIQPKQGDRRIPVTDVYYGLHLYEDYFSALLAGQNPERPKHDASQSFEENPDFSP